jgi:hypothetical protein
MIPGGEDEKVGKHRERERERESRQDDPIFSESELALVNTKRFLEGLANSDSDSQRYVRRLKESLEHELRRKKLQMERGEDPR